MIRNLALIACLMAPAADADVAVKLEAAFRGWVAEVGAERATMTIWRSGVEQGNAAVGMEPDTPVELASLSKAVTGLCAAHLIQTGVWTKQTTSREVLGKGPADLTVEALLTHSAGIGPDQTQVLMALWLDTEEDRAVLATETALKRKEQTATKGSYAYNNENYAVLGAMISAQMGTPHHRYCANAVLIPAGVTTAQPSARTGGMASWGGWTMSVQDYARLMYWAYGPGGMIGRAPDRWPQADMGGGAYYGVGMTQREFRGAMNYWHFGLLCFGDKLQAGSYAVSWMGDWSVVVAYDRCTDWEDMVALDSVLAQAVFQ